MEQEQKDLLLKDFCELIIVNYNYLDYNDEWESDTLEIPINKVIEMIKV